MNSLEEIAELLKNSDDIAIITHVNPDGDALGSAFGLKHALISLGKKVEVVFDAPIGGSLTIFEWGGVVYSDKLDVPKVAVSVDNGDAKRMGRCISLFEKASQTICIDHHITNTNFAKYNFVDDKSASTGEIIFKLIKLLGISVSQKIAQSLYIAILTDSGAFKYSNTKPETLRTVAELMETGIDTADICRKVYDNVQISRLRLQAEAINKIEIFGDGKIAIICMPLELMKKYHASEDDIDGFVNIARSVQGVEVCALLKEREHEVKISFRSNEYVNVAELAATMGGGGHIRASGCTLQGGIDDAKAIIIEKLTDIPLNHQ